jgi:hypothetical protein
LGKAEDTRSDMVNLEAKVAEKEKKNLRVCLIKKVEKENENILYGKYFLNIYMRKYFLNIYMRKYFPHIQGK